MLRLSRVFGPFFRGSQLLMVRDHHDRPQGGRICRFSAIEADIVCAVTIRLGRRKAKAELRSAQAVDVLKCLGINVPLADCSSMSNDAHPTNSLGIGRGCAIAALQAGEATEAIP